MPLHRGNLFLVGLMGAGKTTLGRQLARRLGKRFVDADHELEARMGVPIPTIFEIEGESGFRDREEAVIGDLTVQTDIVLATGGGAVTREGSRGMLRTNGTVLYLHARPETLWLRVRHARHRPMLHAPDPRARLAELYALRDPLYREVADHVIESDREAVMRFVRVLEDARPMITMTVRTLAVELGSRRYPIHIGAGLLPRAPELLGLAPGARSVIVTNATVAAHHLAPLQKALEEGGSATPVVLVPDGESYKNEATLHELVTKLLELRVDRSTTLVALGGGVVGDLCGFAAAVYQRGIPFVQVPTTLLAQVDSSVGGKTGINHPLGKNMIGAFHQPAAVLIDTDCLHTLPPRELTAGFAEVVKYGAIRDVAFFAWLEDARAALMARDGAALAYAIHESCRIKAAIVAADERESGERALLNFGHTFGHAIETAMGYGTWLHGEAVATGMTLAARLSERVLGLPPDHSARLADLLRAMRAPVHPPPIPLPRWLELMARDKKVLAGRLRLILLRTLGAATIVDDVAEAELAALLR